MAKPITQIRKTNWKAWDAEIVVVVVVSAVVVAVAVAVAATQIFAINIFVR